MIDESRTRPHYAWVMAGMTFLVILPVLSSFAVCGLSTNGLIGIHFIPSAERADELVSV